MDFVANADEFQRKINYVINQGEKVKGIFAGLTFGVGIGQLTKEVKDVVDLALTFERMTIGLNTLSKSMGENGAKMVAEVRRITLAQLSAIDATRSLNTALTLIPASAAHMTELATIATGAAFALGTKVKDTWEDILTGLGRASPKILDNLGIIIKAQDAYDEYGKAIGKSAKDLNAEEKQIATLNYVLSHNIERFGLLASVAKADPFQVLQATFTDLRLEIGNKLIPIISKFLDVLNSAVGKNTEVWATRIVASIKFIFISLATLAAVKFASPIINQYRSIVAELKATALQAELTNRKIISSIGVDAAAETERIFATKAATITAIKTGAVSTFATGRGAVDLAGLFNVARGGIREMSGLSAATGSASAAIDALGLRANATSNTIKIAMLGAINQASEAEIRLLGAGLGLTNQLKNQDIATQKLIISRTFLTGATNANVSAIETEILATQQNAASQIRSAVTTAQNANAQMQLAAASKIAAYAQATMGKAASAMGVLITRLTQSVWGLLKAMWPLLAVYGLILAGTWLWNKATEKHRLEVKKLQADVENLQTATSELNNMHKWINENIPRTIINYEKFDQSTKLLSIHANELKDFILQLAESWGVQNDIQVQVKKTGDLTAEAIIKLTGSILGLSSQSEFIVNKYGDIRDIIIAIAVAAAAAKKQNDLLIASLVATDLAVASRTAGKLAKGETWWTKTTQFLGFEGTPKINKDFEKLGDALQKAGNNFEAFKRTIDINTGAITEDGKRIGEGLLKTTTEIVESFNEAKKNLKPGKILPDELQEIGRAAVNLRQVIESSLSGPVNTDDITNAIEAFRLATEDAGKEASKTKDKLSDWERALQSFNKSLADFLALSKAGFYNTRQTILQAAELAAEKARLEITFGLTAKKFDELFREKFINVMKAAGLGIDVLDNEFRSFGLDVEKVFGTMSNVDDITKAFDIIDEAVEDLDKKILSLQESFETIGLSVIKFQRGVIDSNDLLTSSFDAFIDGINTAIEQSSDFSGLIDTFNKFLQSFSTQIGTQTFKWSDIFGEVTDTTDLAKLSKFISDFVEPLFKLDEPLKLSNAGIISENEAISQLISSYSALRQALVLTGRDSAENIGLLNNALFSQLDLLKQNLACTKENAGALYDLAATGTKSIEEQNKVYTEFVGLTEDIGEMTQKDRVYLEQYVLTALDFAKAIKFDSSPFQKLALGAKTAVSFLASVQNVIPSWDAVYRALKRNKDLLADFKHEVAEFMGALLEGNILQAIIQSTDIVTFIKKMFESVTTDLSMWEQAGVAIANGLANAVKSNNFKNIFSSIGESLAPIFSQAFIDRNQNNKGEFAFGGAFGAAILPPLVGLGFALLGTAIDKLFGGEERLRSGEPLDVRVINPITIKEPSTSFALLSGQRATYAHDFRLSVVGGVLV